MVKITGEATVTELETVDAEKTVIFKGKLKQPVTEFADSTVGLSRMGVLQGYLEFDDFIQNGDVKIVKQSRNGVDHPVEVSFESKEGTDAHYRFMLADVINQQLKSIKFKGAAFDVEFVPTPKNLKDMKYFNSVLGAYEANFSPKTENGNLYFYVGDGAADRTKILIAENIKGDIKRDWKWPLEVVLKILALGDNGVAKLCINDQGLLKIEVDSGIGEYTYLLPARS